MTGSQLIAFGAPGAEEWVPILLVWGLVSGLWIWSLVHCAKNPALAHKQRVGWIVTVIVLGIFGSAIYAAFSAKPTD